MLDERSEEDQLRHEFAKTYIDEMFEDLLASQITKCTEFDIQLIECSKTSDEEVAQLYVDALFKDL